MGVLEAENDKNAVVFFTRNHGILRYRLPEYELEKHYELKNEVVLSFHWRKKDIMVMQRVLENECIISVYISASSNLFDLPPLPTPFNNPYHSQPSSICATNSLIILSYWFKWNFSFFTLGSTDSKWGSFLVTSNFQEESWITITSILADESDNFLIGLNNGEVLVTNLSEIAESMLKVKKIIKLGENPVKLSLFFAGDEKVTILGLSNKLFILNREEESRNFQKSILLTEGSSLCKDEEKNLFIMKKNSLIMGKMNKKTKHFLKEISSSPDLNEKIKFFFNKHLETVVINETSQKFLVLTSINSSSPYFTYQLQINSSKINFYMYDDENQEVLIRFLVNGENFIQVYLIKRNDKNKICSLDMLNTFFILDQRIDIFPFLTKFIKSTKSNLFFLICSCSTTMILEKISIKNKTYKTTDQISLRFPIYEVNKKGNLIYVIDIHYFVTIFSVNKSKFFKFSTENCRSLVTNAGFFNQHFFHHSFQNKLLNISVGSQNMFFKLQENVNSSLIVDDSIIFGTQYGNLYGMIKIDSELFKILNKITFFVSQTLLESAIFNYNRWKIIKQNVFFLKFLYNKFVGK